MTEQQRTSNRTNVNLESLAQDLIDAGAVALTAYDGLSDTYLLLNIHRPSFEPNVVSRVRSLCNGIRKVEYDGTVFQFDYEIDPTPPANFGKFALYIPEELSGDGEFSFNPVSLIDGLNNLTEQGGETTNTN